MPTSRFYPQDLMTGIPKVLDAGHSIVHDGQHFTACHTVTVGTATAVGVLISTPATATGQYIHFVCSIESDKALNWTFSEAPNASGGSAITSYNNYRSSTKTDPVTLTHTPTYVSSGTVLETHIMGTNEPTTKLGGGAEARNEWLLKPGTLYLIRATAPAATTQVNVIMPYYYRQQ